MRSTKQLIEENNEKRELLNAENKQLYGDFILYFRTDLRLANHEGEEVLMDLLDHLIEGQKEGKTATDLFGPNPRIYGDELIAGLPKEKKRNVTTFLLSLIFNLIGWMSCFVGIIKLVSPIFIDDNEPLLLGNLIVIVLSIIILVGFAVVAIFKLIRSTLFVSDNQKKHPYWKLGFLGGGSFILIMSITWLLPDWGQEIHFQWWGYLVIAMGFIISSKLLGRISNE